MLLSFSLETKERTENVAEPRKWCISCCQGGYDVGACGNPCDGCYPQWDCSSVSRVFCSILFVEEFFICLAVVVDFVFLVFVDMVLIMVFIFPALGLDVGHKQVEDS